MGILLRCLEAKTIRARHTNFGTKQAQSLSETSISSGPRCPYFHSISGTAKNQDNALRDHTKLVVVAGVDGGGGGGGGDVAGVDAVCGHRGKTVLHVPTCVAHTKIAHQAQFP